MRLRLPDPRQQGRWRRRLPALALAWAVVAALSVLPLTLGPATAAHADSGVTVAGPNRYDPATGADGLPGSVTVTPAKNLSNQVVQVSWSGFTPTVNWDGTQASVAKEGDSGVMYPVRVYQCRGADPKITDCYGNWLYGGESALGFDQPSRDVGVLAPDFPTNQQWAVTGADGSGTASIEVWSAKQSPSLGCDATHPCSIVVEPNYGGDPNDAGRVRDGAADCNDHEFDMDFDSNTATDYIVRSIGASWKTGNWTGERCAWNKRTVVPLEFSPTADDCKAAAAEFSAAGLEMANRAVQQWRSGFCEGTDPLSMQYSPAGGEPQARADFLGGTGATVALTARPDRSPAPRPYVYAPLATTGISVVYLVDDPETGRQIRSMRLNARLMAKMLTQSYTGAANVASVAGNPNCIFMDPEFRQLNPDSTLGGAHWPSSCAANAINMLPIVLGGTTDLVYQLTSWIAGDPDAAQFLQGAPDPWGMHVDSFYLRPKFPGYPVEAFQPQDFSGIVGESGDKAVWKQWEWNPLLGGLGQVARNLLQLQPTAINPDAVGGTHGKIGRQSIGQRTLFAVLDAGQARAFGLPEAALQNPAGAFVTPGLDSYRAAVDDMPLDALTGTQQLPYGTAGTDFAKDQRAYPLTTVQYAMAPTAGLADAKAKAVSTFLRRTTDPGGGQVYGAGPGQLAGGFLGLTTDQLAQAQAAVTHVAAQDGTLPGNQKAPAGDTGPATSAGDAAATGGQAAAGSTGTGSSNGAAGGDGDFAGSAGAGGATGTGAATGTPKSGTASPGAGPLDAAPVAAGRPAPDRAGAARLLLPVALVTGLVLLVGGPAALILGGTPAGARLVGGLRSGWGRLRRTGR
ncbi:hypothetical protein [Kitasatospora sp. NBC_00315]|uniref:hypothetical protein n=1 Tax=Kitasatospora sp. NBC_00315 TaxID=2975963 RepID=UPI00324ACAC0